MKTKPIEPDKKTNNVVNWIATILSIILGFLAVVGWIKEAGKNQAIQDSISIQTQKQWDLRKEDQVSLHKIEQEIAKLQESMEWMKKAHKVVDNQ